MASSKEAKFDRFKLEYLLKKNEISKQDLMEAEDWSENTYYRKLSGENRWYVTETNVLIKLGLDLTDIIDIFF